jgi:IS605 OrfB family transposase
MNEQYRAIHFKVVPSTTDKLLLLRTLEVFNSAATWAAGEAFRTGKFKLGGLHELCYHEVGRRFGLPSELAKNALHKVIKTCRQLPERAPSYRAEGAMLIDGRGLRFCHSDVRVPTLAGRRWLTVTCGAGQEADWDALRRCNGGQLELKYREGSFYLIWQVKEMIPCPKAVTDYLGVDLGIVNLAATSDGRRYSGGYVEHLRRRFARARGQLMHAAKAARSTRSRRNRWRAFLRLRNRETFFRRDINHNIAKIVVNAAQTSNRGIALEDLTYIRERTVVRRSQRAKHTGWGFGQLRRYIEQKAAAAGVPVVVVPPEYTSQTCSHCGGRDQVHRNGERFHCDACGQTLHADINAARNIRALALQDKGNSSAADHIP